MAPTTVLISGANRGLGKGLLEIYVAKPDHTVIAAVRDPSHATAKALADLPTGAGSCVLVVKADASSESDALTAVKEIEKQGIDHLDIVIANAGVAYIFPKVSELKIADLEAHIVPNVYGVVRLYQATLPLLLKSESPKWVTMGSASAWFEFSIPNAAYAPSKAAIHWLTKRLNGEEDKLIAFVVSPGWVQTEMGNSGAKAFGLEQAPLGVQESCSGVEALIGEATKESHGGKLWGHDGKQQAW